MTRVERLAQKETNDKKKLAKTQTALREATRKATDKRRYRVGALADDAGLFVCSDTVLAGLFTALAPLTQVSNPVAVLEALLHDHEGLDLASVDGRADLKVVSALRADLGLAQIGLSLRDNQNPDGFCTER